MKWFIRILSLVVVGLLLGSCDRNPSSNPSDGGTGGSATAGSITLTVGNGTPIQAFRNSFQSVPFTVRVANTRGVAMSGQRILFQLERRLTTAAQIVPSNGVDTTNTNGEMTGFLNMTVDTTEVITVRAYLASNTQVTTYTTLPVILATDVIAQLNVTLRRQVSLVRPSEVDTTYIDASVSDAQGAPIPNIRLLFQVDSARFATLDSAEGTTNAFGRTTRSMVSVQGRYSDSIRVTIRIAGITGANTTRVIYWSVQPLTNPAHIYLQWVDPTDTLIVMRPFEQVTRPFTVLVTDSFGVQLSGVRVNMTVNGSGSIPLFTETSGVGRDTVVWSNNGMIGAANICGTIVPQTMSIGGGEQGPISLPELGAFGNGKLPMLLMPENNLPVSEIDAITSCIGVRTALPSGVESLKIRFIGDSTLTATGMDSVLIRITLKDGQERGIPNTLVQLSAPRGSIVRDVTTNSMGTADAWLFDNGEVTAGSWLRARCPAYALEDSINYVITQLQRLRSIRLIGPATHQAIPSDTISYTVQAELINGGLAYDGTQIRWYRVGNGNWNSPITTTSGGVATNTYRVGSGISVDQLMVAAGPAGDTVVSSQTLTLSAGSPVRVILAPTNAQVIANSPTALRVVAQVRDTAANVIHNPQLTWGATLGSISVVGYDSATGLTAADIRAGTQSGTGSFWAIAQNGIADTLTYNILGASPRTMTLSADSGSISVRGTGGSEHTAIRALLRDDNGNAVSAGSLVRFRIANSTDFGVNMEDSPYFGDPGRIWDTVRTSGTGIALVTLSAGYTTGVVQLEAKYLRSWPVGGDPDSTNIVATLANVQVASGPAYNVEVAIDEDQFVQVGGGQWEVSISARVTDRYTNPVANNIAVRFWIDPDSMGTAQPASTGNLNPNSASVAGTAFSRLRYQGQRSLDTVRIYASCNSRDGSGNPIVVSGYIRRALPLFDGTLQLIVTPNTWHFMFPTATTRAVHRALAICRDGYGTLISRAPIVFYVQRGSWYSTQAAAGNQASVVLNPAIKPTGAYPGNTDRQGEATLWIGATGGPGANQVFLDPQTLEITSEVRVQVVGYPAIQEARAVINYQRN